MSESTFTFRVDESLKQEFAKVAKLQDRTGAQLLRDFMREVVRKNEEAAEYDQWFRSQVQQGLDQANAGELLPGDQVEAHFAAKRAELRRRMAER
ncbi:MULTISPECIES: CopG family ribbon-helix-helix protein [Chromobacterium]|uniref:Uncharacterized protein n=2 Tax=Chromobacterium TaxID=535 RepID=A0ABS3GIW8_9NEIS|nr:MULTISPECIES: hypothetical protein [Chromobacterium]AXT48366.1 hypothetical protein D1345_20345 [Chromobacterium rhizoryzae]MBK0415594.1 hypothetical protein [Chromobacterium haemolyticum]MBO0414986.1 hypothetical protein [Chromobacterium haemolyticum]MBO0498247.1 hypothetical protein [Chromobacterium haemolyticum]MDH0340465.1 hypothetical protein [Chromobacterium haemolyticum]